MRVYNEDNEKLLLKPKAMFFLKKIVLQGMKKIWRPYQWMCSGTKFKKTQNLK